MTASQDAGDPAGATSGAPAASGSAASHAGAPAHERHRWHQRALRRLRHSLKARMVALFLLLALAMTAAFLFGMQTALSTGWRDAARPLLSDYVDRLVAEIGSPPSVARAQALVDRLPVTVRISGPTVQWQSHGDGTRTGNGASPGTPWRPAPRTQAPGDGADKTDGLHDEGRLLTRSTADGHRITLGVNTRPWRDRPRSIGLVTLSVLLLLTALAYLYVRGLLRPLDDIRAGAQRFGAGGFGEPIPIRRRDELGDLAADVNAMAASIHAMLEAKRGLLLAISHELRSPLTRARLNTELLPEDGDSGIRREALLRDLQEMADLVTGLLESERLGQGHAALHLEDTDLGELARAAARGLPVTVEIEERGLPAALRLDRIRVKLLLRNLLENAVRHGDAAQPPLLRIVQRAAGQGAHIRVRDFGAGVDEGALAHLAEPFFRPDASRVRSTGGVGLGLYLCKLVAQAHGGTLSVRNANPGLEVSVDLPG